MNGYGRILLIGWVVALVAGAAEIKWRNALGATAAAVSGLLTLAIAQSLTPGGMPEWIRLGPQAGLWLAAVATALLAAAGVTFVSRRSTSINDAVSARAAGTVVGSVA